MMRTLFHAIATGREWSWSVVGLLVLLGGLTIRNLFLREILHGMKIRNRDWYKRTLVLYQNGSILGWLLFLCFIVGAMLFWRFEATFLKRLNLLEWTLIFTLLFAGSIVCHLRAYACAIVEAVEENVATDKDI